MITCLCLKGLGGLEGLRPGEQRVRRAVCKTVSPLNAHPGHLSQAPGCSTSLAPTVPDPVGGYGWEEDGCSGNTWERAAPPGPHRRLDQGLVRGHAPI